ncbi:MAG: hypothetical protein AAB373_02100 [Patescibacteria group bacterium]
MKKFLTKIALFTFTAIIINFATAPTMVFADDAASPKDLGLTLDDLLNEQCIMELNPDGTDGPDAGYIITIQEEPLPIDEDVLAKEEKGDDYIVRRCFRNTFQYTNDEGEIKILPELSKKCSEKAIALAENSPNADFKPKFSCREVQVILSKGGTAMIYGYIGTIYRFGASMVGIIAVTVIVVSGIQISASGGNQEAIGAGKTRIMKSIFGIIVLFLSGLILYTVNPNFFVQ